MADDTFLLCFDGSPEATRAIQAAGGLLGGGSAIVLYVWSPIGELDPGRPVDAYLSSLGASPEDYNRIAMQVALEVANDGCKVAGGAGFDSKPLTERLRGSVPETIVGVADDQNARLIVLGSHGSSPSRQRFLGSVSNGVAHGSSRPLLMVPTDPA